MSVEIKGVIGDTRGDAVMPPCNGPKTNAAIAVTEGAVQKPTFARSVAVFCYFN